MSSPDTRSAQQFALRWWMPVAVFAVALWLRVFHFWQGRPYIDDVIIHAPTAAFYPRFGLLGPDSWWTPPLKHLLLSPFIQLVGYDPVGWRLRGILASSLVVLLVFLLARYMFKTPFVAFGAAALAALDPLSIIMSRSTHEETVVACVLLAALYVSLRLRSEWRIGWLVALGVLFGVGMGFRWYTAFPFAVMALVLAWIHREDRRTVFLVGSTLVALPVAIYLAAYIPWFTRGYGLPEWISLQRDMLRVQDAGFEIASVEEFRGPLRWLFGWVYAGHVLGEAPGKVTVQLFASNPVVWWLFTPAVAYALYRAVRSRLTGLLMLTGSFLSLYLFCVFSPRPVYLYIALALVPLGAMLLSFAISRLPRSLPRVVLALLIAWCVYLYPLAAPMSVPRGPYEWAVRMVQE